jgi:hypothetical protein
MRDTLKAVLGYSLLFAAVAFALVWSHRPPPPLELAARAAPDGTTSGPMTYGEVRRSVSLAIRH